MSFQIRTKDGEPIRINDIDALAAEVFGIPVHERQYARPGGHGDPDCFKSQISLMPNWYDIIGGEISCRSVPGVPEKVIDWSAVMDDPYLAWCWTDDSPYRALVKAFESRGYVPVAMH